jgi:hypothetical protein
VYGWVGSVREWWAQVVHTVVSGLLSALGVACCWGQGNEGLPPFSKALEEDRLKGASPAPCAACFFVRMGRCVWPGPHLAGWVLVHAQDHTCLGVCIEACKVGGSAQCPV